MRVRAGVGERKRAYGFARVALLTQHALRMRHIVCGFSGFTIFFDVLS